MRAEFGGNKDGRSSPEAKIGSQSGERAQNERIATSSCRRTSSQACVPRSGTFLVEHETAGGLLEGRVSGVELPLMARIGHGRFQARQPMR